MTDYKALYEAQLEENKWLKEENENWEADDANLTKIMSMINALDEDFSVNGVDDIYECVKDLKEENKELEKPLDDYQKVLDYMTGHNDCDVYDVHSDWIIEEIKKLKEQIKELKEANNLWYSGMSKLFDEPDGEKSSVEITMDAGEVVVVRKEFFKNMTGISGECVEEDEPDRCVGCDKTFDLSYTMRHADQETTKKYNEYFGSEEDGGDLCVECLNK